MDIDTALTPVITLPATIPVSDEFVDQISKSAHRQLVEIHQIHAYAQVCVERGTITPEQFKSILGDLRDGYLGLAQGTLVKALAVGAFVKEAA